MQKFVVIINKWINTYYAFREWRSLFSDWEIEIPKVFTLKVKHSPSFVGKIYLVDNQCKNWHMHLVVYD